MIAAATVNRLAWAAIALALPAALADQANAKRPPAGGLSQATGKDGCVTSAITSCQPDAEMQAPSALAMTAGSLYAAGNLSSNLLAFRIVPGSGALTPLPPPGGCFGIVASAGCTAARGTGLAFDVAISPDGRSVYESAGFARQIAVFSRDSLSGQLTQPAGVAGCLQATGGKGIAPPAQTGCTRVRNLSYPRGLAISRDGRFLYAATFTGNSVVAFARDPASGALSEVAKGCVSVKGRGGCARAIGLSGATDVEISPDSRFLYATGYNDDAVTAFARDPASGRLSQVSGAGGCVGTPSGCSAARGIAGPFKLAISRDGRSIYVASRKARSLAAFARNISTGALSQLPGRAGCVSGRVALDCRRARGLDGARGVTVAPNGHTVYAGSFTDSAVTAFARQAGGSLKQLRGRAGCLAARRLAACGRARGTVGAGDVLVSPDGRRLYSGSWRNAPGGIGVFSLNP